MIETNLMRGSAGSVGSVMLLGITTLALGFIVRAVKPSDAARHLGTILVSLVQLIMLPAIAVDALSSLSLWQRLGIVMLRILIGPSEKALQQTRKK